MDKLNEEQLEYLKEIKPDYEEMETVDLYEWLVSYFQEQGLENIDENENQLLLEEIIDIIAEI